MSPLTPLPLPPDGGVLGKQYSLRSPRQGTPPYLRLRFGSKSAKPQKKQCKNWQWRHRKKHLFTTSPRRQRRLLFLLDIVKCAILRRHFASLGRLRSAFASLGFSLACARLACLALGEYGSPHSLVQGLPFFSFRFAPRFARVCPSLQKSLPLLSVVRLA